MAAVLVFQFASPAGAQPSIDVVTNGGTGSFNPGAVVVISGQLSDSGTPLSNNDVLIEVKKPDNSLLFCGDATTDKKGYYRAIFTLPQADALPNGNYSISVSAGQAAGSTTFSVPASTKGLKYVGSGYNSADAPSQQVNVIPAGTNQFALVFSSNVNYFTNNKYESYTIGLNEINQDSITLYQGSSQIAANIVLAETDTQGNAAFSYYDSANEKKSEQRKRVILVEPKEKLQPNTEYTVKISKDLSANSGNTLGKDVTVTFKTGADSSVIPGSGSSGGSGGGASSSTPPATPAGQIGRIASNGGTASLAVDPQKTLGIVNDSSRSALAIDISPLAGTGDRQSLIQFPAQVIDAVAAANKPIILQNGDFAISIPATALVQGQDLALSIAQANTSALPAPPSDAKGTGVYEFNAQVGSEQTHNFQQIVTITLPVPQGITTPDKLEVYYLNDATGQWEYVGGRIIDGKLVFKTGHFSKYMVAESTRTFADISKHWARKTIEVMAARHIVSGVGTAKFAPDQSITRAEFAALLVRVLNLNTNAQTNSFNDVAANAWYSDAISKAAAAGIINGSNGKFRPTEKVTRQEMAVMIIRAYGYTGGKTEEPAALTFTDKSAISSWASDAVKGAFQLEIIKGRPDGKFAPGANATRAEAAEMLKLFMDKAGV